MDRDLTKECLLLLSEISRPVGHLVARKRNTFQKRILLTPSRAIQVLALKLQV